MVVEPGGAGCVGMRWDEGEMGRSGGGHTVRWEVPSCAAAIKPSCVTFALAGGVEMGWDGMGRDGARWGAVAGVRGGAWREGRGGMGEGWVRDG